MACNSILKGLALLLFMSHFSVRASSPLQQTILSSPKEAVSPVSWTRQYLNFSSPAPHLFASTATLLQQWANTIFPNGHAIAPVQIPPLTLFFHGRLDGETPPSPEWLAFDQEMSWGIMGGTRSSFMLTYQTTRPVKALYFDGESATLMGLGQLDTQMLHIWGNTSGPGDSSFRGLFQEYQRATGLCDWLEHAGLRGPGWGFEGVVRMNAGFEMIWCDFNSPSLRLLTRLNVTAPQLAEARDGSDTWGWDEAVTAEDGSGHIDEVHSAAKDDDERRSEGLRKRAGVESSYYTLPPIPTRTDRATDPSNPPMPPNWRRDRSLEPFLASQTWGWFDSATWHYGSSRNGPGLGETRAKIISCGVLSYYSPQFTNQTLNRALEERESLNLTDSGLWMGEGKGGNRTNALKQLSRRRRYHHLGDVSSEEAALMRANSERALRSLLEPYNDCTGAHWTEISTEIMQRTTLQIKMLDSIFAAFPQNAENKTVFKDWLFKLRSQSHLSMVTYLEYPPIQNSSTWVVGGVVYNETFARCQYRYTRLLDPRDTSSLAPEEEDLKWAVEETQKAICSVTLTVGFGVEQLWTELYGRSLSGHASEARRNMAYQLSTVKERVSSWGDAVAELTAWLGWEGEFIGCTEVCAWDERCFIPMWPLLAQRRFGRRPPGNGTNPPWRRPGGPGGYYPPYYGRPNLPPNGSYPGEPGFQMPPRGPAWMGDETDLWEPKCVKEEYITGGR